MGTGGGPTVAVVGRPNVGKSTLFNRLVGARIALVHDEPGVTRDRRYGEAHAFGRAYRLIDTGGLDLEDKDPIKVGIASQVDAALADADAIVFVIDSAAGITEGDRTAVRHLRRTGKPLLCAANKADSPSADSNAFEAYRLGVNEVYPVSALHGRGIGELEAALLAAVPNDAPPESAPVGSEVPRVALVGRPNAGKSSLLNRFAGEERALVDERPGTTRDPVDALVEHAGKKYVIIDTAGIRRKGKVASGGDRVESLSVLGSVRSVERAHVAVVVSDADEGAAEQDAKILGLVEERGRAMVLALSKTDLLSRASLTRAEQALRDKTTFAAYVPMVRTSAKLGRGLGDLFDAIDRVHAAFFQRVGTGELNRFFEQIIKVRPPPTVGGRSPRIFYVTQASVAPPTFVAVTNAPDSIHFSYQRFVINRLREQFGFDGAPIRVIYRARRRKPQG
jgi:GTPase